MSVYQLPNGRWRARAWSPEKQREISACRVLGMPPTSWPTQEEAQYYRRLAADLLHTRFGNPDRKPVARESKGWNLKAKGERKCRACANQATHLHHIVPRAMCPEAADDWKRNGVALCRRCHLRWHWRVLDIPHTALTDEEFAFACALAGIGWVSRHYFDAERPAEQRFEQLPKRLWSRAVKQAATNLRVVA